MSSEQDATAADDPATGPAETFRQLARTQRLAFQSCLDCERAIFPPRSLCPACGSIRLEWRESVGTGTVYSATTVHPRDGVPYTVGLIDVDDHFRVMATIGDAEADKPPIGVSVALTLAESSDPPMIIATLPGRTAELGAPER